MGVTKEKKLQWHPAFYAGLQIELADDAWNLEFENEHQLGTKPMSMDVLIIKKRTDVPVQKNIGRIFKKYNVLEYKSPTDRLSIDDFYKVYGYACFYKSQSQKSDERKVDEVTITFAVSHYPRAVMQHLKQKRRLRIEMQEPGIYYVLGDIISIQILIMPELSEAENLWLKSLTNHMKDAEEARHLIREYGKHQNKNLYQSVMDIVANANREMFEEVETMSEVLREMWKDAFDAEVKKEAQIVGQEIAQQLAHEEAKKLAHEEAKKMVKELTDEEVQQIVNGKAEQIAKEKAGKLVRRNTDRLNELYRRLAAEANLDDIIRASSDMEYQAKLFTKYGI